ncbi:hypothetical protein QYE76_061625 [Lolium multiflorum]|uniref:Uncharacterized protein n=1 Tax=Lolium multiflorum TaxID=4521 RepID=A0AAD8W6I0_LOLMU|nr:hypothetical protein QYE76_061625 [Lolium multiflorum]
MAAADLGTAEWERSKITNQDLEPPEETGITASPKRFASPVKRATQPLQWGGVVISIRSTADYFDVKLPTPFKVGARGGYTFAKKTMAASRIIFLLLTVPRILRRRSGMRATEEERTSTESMARIHELQNTRGKELSGIQIIVYFLKSRVQPLQARKFPLWKYTATKTWTGCRGFEVKDPERLVRKITSLGKKDAIPSSCRVKPYSATHALPKPVIKDLLRIGAQFVGYREYANKAEEKLAEANDRANTLAQQLEQSEKARKRAESDAIDARAEADKAKADALVSKTLERGFTPLKLP